MALTSKTVGLIGCGRWGRLVLRDLVALGVTPIVCDPDFRARAAASAAGAAAVFLSAGDLPQVDGVIVATPASTHAEVVTGVLARGVPLLVEKPLTTSIASAERLAALAEDRLFVGHTWRYHPGVELLGEIARSGAIGTVTGVRSIRTNWTSPRRDVDTIWNLAPHDLTLAIEILGHLPDARAAVAELHDGRAVGMTALLGSQPWLIFDVSNRYRDKRREVRVHGTAGVAVMTDPDAPCVEITHGDGHHAPDGMNVERRMFSGDSALTRQLTAFLIFLDGGAPPKSPAAEGVAVVRCLVRLRELAGLAMA